MKWCVLVLQRDDDWAGNNGKLLLWNYPEYKDIIGEISGFPDFVFLWCMSNDQTYQVLSEQERMDGDAAINGDLLSFFVDPVRKTMM